LTENRFGLNRNIPAEIKRQVRQQSKFGCVVCRCAFYQYEHIDPEFHDAHSHDPDNICLLCGHCHDKVSRGALSKETVRNAYKRVMHDDGVRRPFDEFDLAHDRISVRLGSSVFEDALALVVLNGTVVLAIEPPEHSSTFPALTGVFCDVSGNELMRIERNEWIGPSMAWDMEIVGREITVRTDSKTIALRIKIDPPSAIEILELNMRIGNCHLVLREDLLLVGRLSADIEYYVGFKKLLSSGAQIGVLIDDCDIPIPSMSGFSISPENGFRLEGVGIALGVGSRMIQPGGIMIEQATKTSTVILDYPLTHSVFGTTTVLPPRL